MFAVVVGSRLMLVQPLMCIERPPTTPGCGSTFVTGGGIVGESGVAVRTHRLGGYRLGVALSALAGPISPYGRDGTLRDFYFGGVAGVIVTF